MKTTEFTMPEITISYKDNVKASERIKILSSETSYSYLKPFYSECMEHHEESYVMFLNRANKALGVSFISKGGMAETVMDVKIILQTALKVHASDIILSHNHPSGNLRPSEPDNQSTSKIKEALSLIHIYMCIRDSIYTLSPFVVGFPYRLVDFSEFPQLLDVYKRQKLNLPIFPCICIKHYESPHVLCFIKAKPTFLISRYCSCTTNNPRLTIILYLLHFTCHRI